jgi:hypothetical protein
MEEKIIYGCIVKIFETIYLYPEPDRTSYWHSFNFVLLFEKMKYGRTHMITI